MCDNHILKLIINKLWQYWENLLEILFDVKLNDIAVLLFYIDPPYPEELIDGSFVLIWQILTEIHIFKVLYWSSDVRGWKLWPQKSRQPSVIFKNKKYNATQYVPGEHIFTTSVSKKTKVCNSRGTRRGGILHHYAAIWHGWEMVHFWRVGPNYTCY